MSIRMVVSRGFNFTESGGGGMVSPVLVVADNVDGSTADADISGSTPGGPLNSVIARLANGSGEIITAGSRNGDGALTLTFPSTGEWLAYIESVLGDDTAYSTPVLFTIRPAGGGVPDSGSGQLVSASLVVSADTYISNGSDMAVNFGSSDTLRVGSTFIASVNKHYRILLRIPLGSFPRDVAIDGAFLVLTGDGSGSTDDLTLTAYRLDQQGWVEDEATWLSWATGELWDAAGGDFLVDGDQEDYEVGDAGFSTAFTLAAMIAKALDLGLPFLDILVKGPETPSAPSNFIDFYSRTAVVGVEAFHPYLAVNYRLNMTGSVASVVTVRPALVGSVLVNAHANG